MSSSDHCTAAYGSQGSSAKTLSVTLADHTQIVEQSSSGVDAAGIPSAAEPRLAGASATATPYGNGQPTEEEEALFLNDEGQQTPPPLPPPLSSSPRAVPAPVVDRREISAADISSMRWEGCRTHRLTPSSSTHASVYGGTQASTPFSVALPRTSRATSGHYVDPQDGGDSGAAVSVATAASLHRRSSAASPGATTLDTSIAILQHMASDTAARVSGQRPFLSPLAQSTTPTPTAASPAAPLSTQLRTAVPPAPAVAQAVPEQETDPIGLHLDSEPDGGVSQPHTGSTRQYVRSATPGSSLHSLSDSELCAGQVRGLGTSRNVSAQALSRLGEETAAEGGEWRAGEPPGLAKRRLHLVAVPSCNQVAGQSCPAAGGGASAASVPFSSTSLAAGQAALDASVYNHDFQRIISHEVKEALTRNMRPSAEEDDEDEDDTLLNDVLSAQASPGTVSVKRHGSTVGLGESRNSAFAPFQLPMAATSLGRLDSIVGLPPCGAGARAAQQPLSLSTAALEETSPTLTMGGGTGTATTTSSAATSGGSKGVSPQLVSAQAWRFPTLGVDAATPSSAAPRRPSSGSHDEEGKAATAKTAAGEAADTSPHVPAASQQPPSEAATPTTTPTGQHSSGGGGGGSAAVDAGGDGLRGGPAPMTATAGWVAPFSPTPPPPPSPSPAGPQGGGVVAMLALGTAVPEERSAPAAPSAVRSDSGGGAATVVRVEDGRLYTRPFISITSSSSLPGSGNMPDESFARKLDMVHTVYERLARQERHAATPKAVKTLLLMKPTAPAAAPQAFAVTPQLGSGGAVAAGQTPGTGLGSRARRSPSLSCSGALGRSAGYYSFGTRVSLSHPNRQSLPLQYLGSSSNLAHGTPSPGTTVLGSPAVMDLVAGGGHGGPPAALALCSNAPENSLTHRSVSAARVARRGLDSGIVRRIEARPLLQSTLFLQHVLYTIREAHGSAARLTEKARGSTAATATTLASPADLSRHTDAAAANAVVPSAGADRLASMATPLGSVANVTTDSQELSSGRTRGPSSGSSRSSFVDRAATAAAAAAGGRAGTVGSSAPGGERRGRPSVHADRSSSGSRTTGDSPQSYNASRTQPAASAEATEAPPAGDVAPGAAQPSLLMKAEDAGGAAQRYYRALTEAEHRVRHVHGVDGVEREVDNESLDLIVYVGMRLLGWLEVVSLLGCGSFGQVFLCKDLRICDGHYVHPSEIAGVDYEYWNCSHAFLPFSSVDVPPTNPPLVAVKVVKSVPLLEQQSVLEAEMLVLIGAQTAASADEADAGAAPPPEDPRCASVAKVLADGICYGHHCIVMERYGANLYEYIASKEHSGLPMYQIRSIGRQLFSALSLIHEECHIIHADIKPENMLLTLDSSRGVVRTSDAAVAQVAKATATTAAARECSPPAVPPRHAQRTEGSVSASTSCSPERSYITLRSGPTAAAAGGRQRQHSRRSSALPQELSSSSAVGRAKGQSFYHLRSSISSGLTMVEQSSIPAPEPRRVHALTQPAGMISAKAAAGSMAPADPLPPPSMVPRLHVKLIDFSSSCYDGGPFYQYIQSRYYRAPEVIVGASYSAGIDIWSSGCMLAELLLGMPLLPGCNDHHQLCLIEEMVGPLPTQLITEGLNTELYYTQGQAGDAAAAGQGGAGAQAPPSLAPPRPYTLRSREDYLRITQSEPQPYRRYFTYQTLQELVRHCPLTLEERRMSNGLQPYVGASESSEIPPNATPSPSVRAEMMKQRFLLFDLLRKLLQTDAAQRPTASQALTHPFFTSAPPYMKTFKLE